MGKACLAGVEGGGQSYRQVPEELIELRTAPASNIPAAMAASRVLFESSAEAVQSFKKIEMLNITQKPKELLQIYGA